jgi:DNA-binding beta-propeller fold protein YncE
MSSSACALRRTVLVAAIAAAAAPAALPGLAWTSTLCVTSQFTRNVRGYDGITGAPLGVFATDPGINDPIDVVFGPDRNLYLSNGNANNILRFHGITGAYLGVFASGGGLSGPIGMTFGPDGNLYVCSDNSSSILRYDGTTGAFIDTFVPSGSGGISVPRGLAFGADGNLYVGSYNNASVMRFDGTTGAFIDVFVSSGSGGLTTPQSLAFGPDGNLYLPGGNLGAMGVRRYSGTTGAFIDLFAPMPSGYGCPSDIVFGPDDNLYVVVWGCFGGSGNVVLRFKGTTGAFMGEFVHSAPGGPDFPFGLAFSPKPFAGDFGDAPNGSLAYSTGVIGHFPTCLSDAAGFVVHADAHSAVYFGSAVDPESDGNGGACAWPPNDSDECFGPPDAGLIVPDAYTLGSPGEVTCPGTTGKSLGMPCATATWGDDIDIQVVNGAPSTMYVNLLIDWNQDGSWAGSVLCDLGPVQEHVLVDFPVPAGYTGPLSGLGPPTFVIGPNLGFVWARFTIGEAGVGGGWRGARVFNLGETEDYLIRAGGPTVDVPQTPRSGRLGLELEAMSPNPAGPGSVIAFTLDRAAPLRLTVNDASGRAVAVLVDGEQVAGRHQVTWNGKADGGRTLAPGFYFMRAQSGTLVRTQKVAFVR